MIQLKNNPILILSAVILSVFISDLRAQNTTVLSIESGGTMVDQTNLVIIQPMRKPQNIPAYPNKTFPSGTKIRTPGSTTIHIGANGNEQIITPNTLHQVIIDSNGEKHQTISGKVLHYIYYHPKDYSYKVTGNREIKKGYVTPDKTVFSVEVNNNDSRYETIKGQITAFEQVNVKVKEVSKNNASKKSRPITTTKSQIISEGQPAYVITNEIDDLFFDSYEQARSQILNQLSSYDDDGQNADNNLAIGELYLDDGNPTDAITYFNKALNYYNKMDFEEMSIAETYLLMAEAYLMSGNNSDKETHAQKAINIILPLLRINELDYEYAYNDGDSYLAEDIAFDLFYNYDYLGWAYELLGYIDKANDFYDEADNLPVSGYEN